MIDIDEIEEICDVMIEGGFQHCPPAGCGSAEKVKELIGMLRKAEVEAKRYRWLRDVADEFQISDFFMCSTMPAKRDGLADKEMGGETS